MVQSGSGEESARDHVPGRVELANESSSSGIVDALSTISDPILVLCYTLRMVSDTEGAYFRLSASSATERGVANAGEEGDSRRIWCLLTLSACVLVRSI